jgi:pimeloyl-ACP methyl ester carboxylesterase
MKEMLVIIPGWGGSHETWKSFTDLAQEKYDVQVIDLPCFGDEPCPKDVWGVVDYANFVKQRISQLPNRPIAILGHSFGGVVATSLAANNPAICTKLIICGAPIIRRKRGISKSIIWLAAKMGKILFKLPFVEKLDVFAKKAFYRIIHSDYNKTSGIQREIFKKIIQEDQSGILSSISIPTLVIFGDKDTYVHPSDGEKIAHMIVGSKLEMVSGGKHGLHIQQPENLFRIIDNFI